MLGDVDIEAQLIAIRGLLNRNARAEKEVSEEIESLKTDLDKASGEYAHHLDDRLVDQYHASVFLDAANSLSAAGMLAPLIESYFTSAFPIIAERLDLDTGSVGSGDRRNYANARYWDPHVVFGKSSTHNDIARGIAQLASAIELDAMFPDDYARVLTALFAYRNKIFHHGFEWPMEERKKFLARVGTEDWPEDWFSQSTSGGEPWIIYMSETFVQKCLDTFEGCLAGVGRFIRPDGP
jgi:hypothetical protein